MRTIQHLAKADELTSHPLLPYDCCRVPLLLPNLILTYQASIWGLGISAKILISGYTGPSLPPPFSKYESELERAPFLA